MMSSLHPLLSGPAPRRTAYCVDCYAQGGKVTVATRMFCDDELCDPHYLALCKDMGVEPDVITLSEARAAKEIGQLTPIKKIRQAAKPPDHPITRSPDHPIQAFPSDSDLAEAASSLPSDPAAPARLQDRSAGDSVDPRGIADAAIHKTRPSRSVSSGSPAGVLTRAVGMPNCGSRQNGITSEHRNQARHAGETAAKASDSPIPRSADVPMKLTSQRPDSSVAPAAEGLRDRAHSPTRPAPSQGSGVPQTPSAANPQPSQPERNANPMANICGRPGCGKKLSAANHSGFCGDHWYDSKKKNGATRGHKPAANQSPQVHVNDVAPPHQSNGHAMPPVTIANGNGHPAPPIQMIARSVIAADGAYLVPCQVSEWAMDRIWLRLTPEEKAELLFRLPEAPQKEQQEPSHA